MRDNQSEMLRYIWQRQRGDSGIAKRDSKRTVSLDQEAVEEDDLHGGQLLPALHKVLHKRKQILAEEFSYAIEDLESLQVECDHRSDLLSVSMAGSEYDARPSNEEEHDRHWHILFEIGMTQCVLRGNREVCVQARKLARQPSPTPHEIEPEQRWFFANPSQGEPYAALSNLLGLPARLLDASDLQRGEDVLARLSVIVREQYSHYWLPQLGMLGAEGEAGSLNAARSIARVPEADRLLVQGASDGAIHCLRRDSKGNWWLLSPRAAEPIRTEGLTNALQRCGAADGIRIMPFRAPMTIGNDGKVAKWGQVHAHFVMTKNLMRN